jgi:hypothetical protein
VEKGAVRWSHLETVSIETGNRHFSMCGKLLLDFEGRSIVGHIGLATSLCIGRDIRELCDACFLAQTSLVDVTFEADSRLQRIGAEAFSNCPRLSSIVVPASVETLGFACFNYCIGLSNVDFEANSRLSEIDQSVFNGCLSLKTVRIRKPSPSRFSAI